MITVGELRKGIFVELEREPFNVVDYQHVKMGRGGAVVRLKLRHIKSGYSVERTFPASEKFQRIYLEQRSAQYLYRDGDLFHFMDTETYEQTILSAELLGDAVHYLLEGATVELQTYRDEALGIELPVTVDLRVTETDPGFKGDTATGGTKPAILETGLKVLVPLFVDKGDVVRVDTRTGQYLERAT